MTNFEDFLITLEMMTLGEYMKKVDFSLENHLKIYLCFLLGIFIQDKVKEKLSKREINKNMSLSIFT